MLSYSKSRPTRNISIRRRGKKLKQKAKINKIHVVSQDRADRNEAPAADDVSTEARSGHEETAPASPASLAVVEEASAAIPTKRGKASPAAAAESTATVRHLLARFCAESTAHGLPHLVKGSVGCSLIRTLWIAIFCLSMIGECIHLAILIYQYLEYPTTESVQVSPWIDPQFPAITMCNANPFSDLNYNSSLTGFPAFDEYREFAREAPLDWEYLYAFYNRVGSAKGSFENVDRAEIVNLGHRLEDLVLFCAYRGLPCDYESDFIRYDSPTYFNCYTYHVPQAPVDVGTDKGITLILFLEDAETLFYRDSYVEQTLGARIELHPNGALPNPVVNGMSLASGFSTSVAVRQTHHTKLGPPYSWCEERENLPDLSRYRYTAMRCYDVCKMLYVYDMCGCVDPGAPIPDSLRQAALEFNVTVTSCGVYSVTQGVDEWRRRIACERETLRNFTTTLCTGDYPSCDERCKYDTYDVTMSQSKWPALNALQDTYADFIAGSNTSAEEVFSQLEPWEEVWRERMWRNLARVNVYFDDARVVAMREVVELFADVGGAIGLWAGLSFITVLEFASLPVQLLILYVKRRRIEGMTSTD